MRYLLCLFKRSTPLKSPEKLMKITTNSEIILGDKNNQILGLTDQHIHYLTTESIDSTQPRLKSHIGIHQQMRPAFKALRKSALKAGLELKIASGFRSFERQLYIWNNKFNGNIAIKNMDGNTVDISKLSDWQIIKSILVYSALPGASRHHWGCDIDVYAPNLLAIDQSLQLEPWEYQESGPMASLSTWLTEHAAQFEFYMPYDCYRGGVAEEPWHLSFLPLAKQYQKSFDLQILRTCLQHSDIAGKTVIIDNLEEIATQYINNVNAYK